MLFCWVPCACPEELPNGIMNGINDGTRSASRNPVPALLLVCCVTLDMITSLRLSLLVFEVGIMSLVVA